jgi:tRNA threonylcarbamoyladenosine dehydratase
LNRHASATLSTVGTPKATSLCTFLSTIAPFVKYEPIIDLWTIESAPTLLDGKPDFIIDAIDNITTKIDLLAYCHTNNLRVISSMGSGCKSDPTRVQVGDISETQEDPLSRSTRRGLRIKGIETGIQVVYSLERPSQVKLLPLSEEEFAKGNVEELSALPNFRVRILPVIGMFLAPILSDLEWRLIVGTMPAPPSKLRPKLYAEIHGFLKNKYDSFGSSKQQPNCPFSMDDVGYIVEEVFRGRSILEPFHTTRLTLIKWRSEGAPTWGNMVCFTKAEAGEHEKRVLSGNENVADVYSSEIVSRVEKIWEEERQMRGSRWGEMYNE